MYENLFAPGQIGKVTIKNRLVMSPMGIGLAELDGSPSEDMLAFYEARAIGGAGLIIPEITRVNDVHGPGLMRQLSVTQDRHIPGLARLAAAVHKYGAKIFIQLHNPGRETVSALIGGQPVVSASAIPCKYLQQETRALSTEEVQQLISQFVAGAVRVQKAGCDGVELHAAHGYLLQQFLSPYTNKREDQYSWPAAWRTLSPWAAAGWRMSSGAKRSTVVLATGSKSIIPGRIPGIGGPNVHTIEDILSGSTALSGKRVAVIGAGSTGIETAEYLCAGGNTVTIVDQLDKVAPAANHTNVADVCGRLNKYGVKFLLSHSLKEIREGQVVLERLSDHAEVAVEADAVVLSLGFRPDNALAEELRALGLETVVVGNAVKDGTLAPAVRSGYEAGLRLFRPDRRAPSFRVSDGDLPNFGKVSLMKNQEGVYLAYLTDPAAIARVLPPPLKPFSIPVVTLSVCHVKEPTFADDYYEAILGVYATYGTTLGLYPLGLVLGGPGAEMAVQCGRDNGSIPKKLGAEFVMRRNGDTVTAQVTRRGTQLVNLSMELGQYNSPLTGTLYQFPAPGKKTYGGGFYFHFDREPDEQGVSHFMNGCLLQNLCEYTYHTWMPGFGSLRLQSSIDDPWAELPINTIVGGAYSYNDLMVHKLNLAEKVDADDIVPYLLTGRYDRTAFMETGRF